MWLYYNFLQPVMRLTEKTLVSAERQRARVRRRYDQALWNRVFHGAGAHPLGPLCVTTAITQKHREQLEGLRDRTNPRQLRQEI